VRLRLVHRQQVLVDLSLFPHNYFISQQDMKKRELRNVAAQHNDANRERR
jgi:hypothetical protein